MAEVSGGFFGLINEGYTSFMTLLPLWVQGFLNFFFLVLLIVVYAIFVWKFYRKIAKKNIIDLNLSQYNKSEHAFFAKFFGGLLYLIEYIILSPLWIFIWFAVFTIFLIFLTENLEVSAILLIAATVVAAIRMTSYYKEDLSKDLAKMLPFTLLAVSILNPGFFNFERIFEHITQMSTFLSNIFAYLVFIVILEIILRLFDFIFSLFGLETLPEVEED